MIVDGMILSSPPHSAAPDRVVCLDTETTGLSPESDRIVQIACVEVMEGWRIGRKKSWLVDPGVVIPAEATRVHGITNEMVAEAPSFRDIAKELLEFLGISPIVAHNAKFDIDFVNAELQRAGSPTLPNEVIDTVPLLRRAVGTGRATLDAGCRFFGIPLDVRKDRHDALIDAELLAELYGYLIGARRKTLFDAPMAVPARERISEKGRATARRAPEAFPDRGLGAPTPAEREAHAMWRHGFGLPALALMAALAACGTTIPMEPVAPPPAEEAAIASRVEIRDERKDISPGDRVVSGQPPRATAAETPARDARDVALSPAMTATGSRDIVDARTLATLAALLGGVPTSSPLAPPPSTNATPPPTGMSPALHLIPRQ